MFNPINSSLPSGETTGGCNNEHDNNSDGSSDEDSISLLHDLNTIQSKEGMQHCGLILATNSKESKNMMEISKLQVAEYDVDDADNANYSQNGNMHKEMQLYETDENEDALPHKTCRGDEACGEVITQAGDIVNLENIAALHEVFAEGNVEGVQELFNADADINAISNDDTPLLDSISSGHHQTARHMLALVEKKQKEISTWSLTQQQNGVIYLSALTNIQNELAEIFVKQQFEKNNLVHKYKSMTSPILRHGVKIQFLSLCSRQRKLVNILQMQINWVHFLDDEKISTQNSQVVQEQQRQFNSLSTQPLSSKMTEMKKGSQDKLIPKRGTQKSTRQSNPQKRFAQTKDNVRTVFPSPLPQANRQDHSYALRRIQANNVQTQDIYPLSQGRAKEHSKHLSQLIQKGLIPHGGVLQIFLKGKCHSAHVQGNGSIKDSKGKSHLFPECWLQSILANNIPVSSMYAWDKCQV
ncbi:uncharacterized protein LOC133556369 isoform X2 [Nerophis ophidion]|uniref:uncharacterized protein LOC133556369 isoform X2 n=1 Tax=Nerophis ophidion TaxID=159077 RepID=UPI002ADF2822|nr:uncharacterized protein LOC133556369 isoform X2 [Nerophis ophidion]